MTALPRSTRRLLAHRLDLLRDRECALEPDGSVYCRRDYEAYAQLYRLPLPAGWVEHPEREKVA